MRRNVALLLFDDVEVLDFAGYVVGQLLVAGAAEATARRMEYRCA